jgi:hypothetical protein
MIYFISGPTGVGKTDTAFLLLTKLKNSFFLDSNWLSAKNPYNPHSKKSILEMYEQLFVNIKFIKTKGVENIIVCLYLTSLEYFEELLNLLQSVRTSFSCILLNAGRKTLLERINSRERKNEIKKAERNNIDVEIN